MNMGKVVGRVTVKVRGNMRLVRETSAGGGVREYWEALR